jgi:AraC family transcriptional activator of pyochelin receptor
MSAVNVSAEMLTLFGNGDLGVHAWPPRPVAFEIDATRNLIFHGKPTRSRLNAGAERDRLLLIVDRQACERLFADALLIEDGACFLMSADLKRIASTIRNCPMHDGAAEPYRLAKSIELICEVLLALSAGSLPPGNSATLSLADCQRVAAARQLIDENWGEPLTLSLIARRCGLNRSKLSRGFRELYRCSVSEALAERRLAEASRELISTDLPVGLIGYRSGYQNNASFSRAFCRRFGLPPSDFRLQAFAA